MMIRVKWVVGVIAVLSAFLVGFGLGWKLHRPEPLVRTVVQPATPIASAVATDPPPQSSTPLAWPTSPVPPLHGVTRVDATHYDVERRTIDDLLADPNAFRSARIVPDYVDGGVAGIRIFGVRPSSPTAALGIQNGDRLETLNGYSLATPESALEAYTKLRSAKEVTLTLERHGAPMTIQYRLTD